MLESNDKFGKFNSVRWSQDLVLPSVTPCRILLSSLEVMPSTPSRLAVLSMNSPSVPGVKEDVTNIILNLKQVRFKQVVEEFENEKLVSP